MKKAFVITAAILLTAGGTLWAAVSMPSTSQNTAKSAQLTTQPAAAAQTMSDHVCGTRFCGHHCHHHCHTWCDGRRHWHCPGHD